jgi:DNA-binding MarR family transcriptional regulator
VSSLTPTDHRPLLSLGSAAPDVRRAVGPTAWAVLECLAGSCVDRAGETVSYESVRGIADSLDLAKDTIAGAVRRLSARGLVMYVASRADDGRFGSSHYRLTLPRDLFVESIHESTPAPPKPKSQSTRPRPLQLSLIDALAIDP